MIRDQASFDALTSAIYRFVRDRLVPIERQVDELDMIPPHIVAEMRSMGLFGLTIPTEYGGMGLSIEEELRLVFEFGQTAPAFHTVFGGNNGIGAEGIVLSGTELQKLKYLGRLASGELIGAFAMTEPNVGSDAASVSLQAAPAEGGWVLNGTKRYITNGPVAGLFTILARTGTIKDGADGISTFLVEAGTPGLSVGPAMKKMGHHGSAICDVVLTDCFVPSAQMLGDVNAGYRLALQIVDRGRLRVAALCVGIADRLIADGLRYAKDRVQFGRSIAEFQLIQAKLADSETDTFAGRSMVISAAQSADLGEDIRRKAACCKYFCSEMVGRIADRVLQIHGGAGYLPEMSAERLYRDVRLFRLYEGTSEIQQLIIARDMLKHVK